MADHHLVLHMPKPACLLLDSDEVRQALMWPERLGVVKPYDDMIDTSVEDRLRGEINSRKNGNGPFEPLSSKLGLSLTKDKKLF